MGYSIAGTSSQRVGPELTTGFIPPVPKNYVGMNIRDVNSNISTFLKKTVSPGNSVTIDSDEFFDVSRFITDSKHLEKLFQHQNQRISTFNSENEKLVKLVNSWSNTSNVDPEGADTKLLQPGGESSSDVYTCGSENVTTDCTITAESNDDLDAETKSIILDMVKSLPTERIYILDKIKAATDDIIKEFDDDCRSGNHINKIAKELSDRLKNASCTVAKDNVVNFLLIRKQLKDSDINKDHLTDLTNLTHDFLNVTGSEKLDERSVASGATHINQNKFRRICNQLAELNMDALSYKSDLMRLIINTINTFEASDVQKTKILNFIETFFSKSLDQHACMGNTLKNDASSCSFDIANSYLRHEALSLDLLKSYTNEKLGLSGTSSSQDISSQPDNITWQRPVYYIDNSSDNRIYVPYTMVYPSLTSSTTETSGYNNEFEDSGVSNIVSEQVRSSTRTSNTASQTCFTPKEFFNDAVSKDNDQADIALAVEDKRDNPEGVMNLSNRTQLVDSKTKTEQLTDMLRNSLSEKYNLYSANQRDAKKNIHTEKNSINKYNSRTFFGKNSVVSSDIDFDSLSYSPESMMNNHNNRKIRNINLFQPKIISSTKRVELIDDTDCPVLSVHSSISDAEKVQESLE